MIGIKAARRRARRWITQKQPRIQSLIGRLRRQRVVHMLHVGKSGGSAVKDALRRYPAPGTKVILHPHQIGLADIPANDEFFLFVRDPVDRFVSGFNSRLREGFPRYQSRWSPGERRAFARFKTADDLAEALSSPDEAIRSDARWAMTRIQHVREHMANWLGTPALVAARRERLLLVGRAETLEADFERLRVALGLPAEARLPDDPAVAHRAPARPAALGPTAAENVRAWYEEDYRLIAAITGPGRMTGDPDGQVP